jgi:hypothetical protein
VHAHVFLQVAYEPEYYLGFRYHDHNYQAYKVFGEIFMNDSISRCGWASARDPTCTCRGACVCCVTGALRSLDGGSVGAPVPPTNHAAGLRIHGRQTCFTSRH